MPIRQHTCYVAVCDECKSDIENVDMWTPHFDSAADAMSDARDGDWTQLADGSVFCPGCVDDLIKQGVIEETENDDESGPVYQRVGTAPAIEAAGQLALANGAES